VQKLRWFASQLRISCAAPRGRNQMIAAWYKRSLQELLSAALPGATSFPPPGNAVGISGRTV